MSDNDNFGGLPADLTPDGAPGGPVESGRYAYLVTTGMWDFMSGDPSGITDPNPKKRFSTLTDGPYSSVALAEKAADIRFNNSLGRFGAIDSQMEVSSQGSRGPHGGVVEWCRYLTCIDHTGEFGNEQGWQIIQLVYVDEMP